MNINIPIESFQIPDRLRTSSWIEHTPFAMFLVSRLTPDVVVELGVHNGVSLCAFAQSAKSKSLPTRLYGIDAFIGDGQAGFYGENVYTDLIEYLAKNNLSEVSILKGYFSDFSKTFKDKSIDLLHIDGLHDYNSVKTDYETWLPKVKDGGLILFHDTNVYDNGFGVWKLWKEISKDKNSFEFDHGHGLGVLAVGQGPGREIAIELCESSDMIKALFSALGQRIKFLLDSKNISSFIFGIENCEQYIHIEESGLHNLTFESPPSLSRAKCYFLPIQEGGILRIQKIYAGVEKSMHEIDLAHSKLFNLEANFYVFKHQRFDLLNVPEEATRITFQIYFEKVDVNDYLYAEVKKLQNELSEIKKTISWKITSPLRGVRKIASKKIAK